MLFTPEPRGVWIHTDRNRQSCDGDHALRGNERPAPDSAGPQFLSPAARVWQRGGDSPRRRLCGLKLSSLLGARHQIKARGGLFIFFLKKEKCDVFEDTSWSLGAWGRGNGSAWAPSRGQIKSLWLHIWITANFTWDINSTLLLCQCFCFKLPRMLTLTLTDVTVGVL